MVDSVKIGGVKSKSPIEGWINSPTIKKIFQEYYSEVNRMCANEFTQTIMFHENKIRNLYLGLEMKIQNMLQIPDLTTNHNGYIREINSVKHFEVSILNHIDEKETDVKNWNNKVLELIADYNLKISESVERVTTSDPSVVIDFPLLDKTDIPSVIDEEIQFIAKQRKSYESKIQALKDKLTNQESE
jgi:hypothetical protein